MSLSDFEDFEDFEKGLLRSAETDEPTAASRAANRAAVMKAAGLATAGAAASASASANASAAGAAGKTTATAKVAIAAKLAAVPKLAALAAAGVVAAGVVVTAIAVQGSSGSEPVPLEARPSGSALVRPAPATAARSEGDEVPTAPPPASLPSVMSPPPESVAHAATGGAEAAANRDPIVARTPSVPASAGPTEPSRPTLEPLAEETRLLEEARTCMDRGDLACGAAKLGEHRARFAHGMLTEEAAVLRIQVARRRGDVEEARRLANELLHANPNGPYARRARAILDELARAEQPDR
ncbi:MAG: hypothetical protein KF795_13615 [Labilithrix sp.]|nr:hypothetical protein [Labilithrix sp.]